MRRKGVKMGKNQKQAEEEEIETRCKNGVKSTTIKMLIKM